MQKNHELTSSVITRANSLPYIHSKMVLPDSVTGIAAEAFMKRNCIESIHMPMHLQRIGLRAFPDASDLPLSGSRSPQS